MNATKTFKEILKLDFPIAGGKGASLGEMTQAGISVPPGFVVLAGAFDRFLAETDLGVEIETIIKKVNAKNIDSVEEVSTKIRDLILDAEFPKDIAQEVTSEFKKMDVEYVAVRSSATAEDSLVASWAGELESYLNINEKNLLDSVKKCWSSLFNTRAIFYRFEKNFADQKVLVAVVVQKMAQSEISGIAFTVNPVTKDKNQMVIESGWGLGDAIVGGKITPDTYIIDKNGEKIIDKNISKQNIMIVKGKNGTEETSVAKAKRDKQKLSDKQIMEVAKICTRIEKHYQSPQDIEWAIEKNKIYITQSRPISTL